MTRRFVHALIAAALSVAGLPSALGHGGLSMDEDFCKLRVGPYVIHFVGYQPDSASGPKEFCEDIPETGRTVIVLDYVDDALRDLPTGLRIIRDTGSESNLEDITLLQVPPKIYPTGSLNFELNFSDPGKFVGVVTVSGSQQLVSRFPFSVGRSRHWLHVAVGALVAIAAVIALYRVGVRRRNKAAAAVTRG